MKTLKDRLGQAKILIMDVDGTLTDGRLYYGLDGEAMKAFHVRDGYRLAQCPGRGIATAIITGRRSAIVEQRAKELHISEVFQGAGEKLPVLQELLARRGLTAEDAVYIGDDLNDLACIRFCGVGACPADAEEAVRQEADYICHAKGGEGAVRELLELMFRAAGKEKL